MRITQGTFSYLPDLTDQQIVAQVAYALDHGWAVSIETTDDPHPRNVYWDMWGMPMFDVHDPAAIMQELRSCRERLPNRYIKISAYDAQLGRQTTALSFIVSRPPEEPGFNLERQEQSDRSMRYTLRPYAADMPHGKRYLQ
jgi:ribulose-bisphosphate carboxylase small chain